MHIHPKIKNASGYSFIRKNHFKNHAKDILPTFRLTSYVNRLNIVVILHLIYSNMSTRYCMKKITRITWLFYNALFIMFNYSYFFNQYIFTSQVQKSTHIPAQIIVVIASSPIIFYPRFPRIGLRQQYCSQIKRF